MTQWRVDAVWTCPGMGCRGADDTRHAPHSVAKVKLFDTEDQAARWRLHAQREGPHFVGAPNAQDLDIDGPYPVGDPPKSP